MSLFVVKQTGRNFKKKKVPKNISFLGKKLIFNFFNAPISCVSKVIQPRNNFRIFIEKVGWRYFSQENAEFLWFLTSRVVSKL